MCRRYKGRDNTIICLKLGHIQSPHILHNQRVATFCFLRPVCLGYLLATAEALSRYGVVVFNPLRQNYFF